MSAPKLPPITRDPNSTIPDYEAHVDILFTEMVKINDRLARALNLLEDNPMKKPAGAGDHRDFQTMALLLPEGGDPSWEQQILKMRDDFYSGDPSRKKPWLDIMYDRYDNVDVGKLDPAKPEEARMLLESAALSQTFPMKLNENYDYKKERYKTAQAQNVVEQRNEYGLAFESMAQVAVAKAYDGKGKRVSKDDPLPDVFAASEFRLDSSRTCYYMGTAMTTFSAADARFFYPVAQRVTAEYQMHKTGNVQPLRFTLPQEFSAFAQMNIDEIDPQEIMSGPLSLMARGYIDKMFLGRNNLNDTSNYSKRVFINGKSVAEIVDEKFPDLRPNERTAMFSVATAIAMSSGKDKVSTVFAIKDENDLYHAYPIKVDSDLSAVYASPQALAEAKQRQAQADSRELTPQEQETYARCLKEANRSIFDFSAKSKKEEFKAEYKFNANVAKEAEAMKGYALKENEQAVKDKLFIENEINQLELSFYSENGVAEPMEQRSKLTSIPGVYSGRSIDGLTLENCGTKDNHIDLSSALDKFAIGNMRATEVVLIDGKSVSALVSERYPTVTNPTEQRHLGNAMLGIALSNGQHRLTTINQIETGVPGVLQIQEKPIHLNVTAMYPTKEDEFNWFHRTFLDWGPLKCVTKGEIAQKSYDKLMATPLTDIEKETKMVTLQKLNQKIIQNTCEKAIKDYRSPEQEKITKEKSATADKFSAEKDAIIKNKLEAWTKTVLAPAEPKKEVQASVEKVASMDKEIQAKPIKKAGVMSV